MRFLFIPGTGGVTFSNELGQPASFVLDIVRGRFAGWTDRIVAELSCEHPHDAIDPWAPTRTSLLSEKAALTPREVLRATAYPSVSEEKYEMFAYDWRADIRFNASQLLKQLRNADEPTSLLTHSQGALIVVAASLLCADRAEWESIVHHVALVAPPIIGTINAMDAMINGSNFGGVNSDFFRAASRTWPSLYQMFPRWACVEGEPLLRSTSGELWPGESPMFRDLLGRAGDFIDWVGEDPFRNMSRERVMVVLGQGRVANTATTVAHQPNGPPRVLDNRVQGDTLVPYQMTFDFLESLGYRQRIMTVKGPSQPDHFRLLGDVRVYSDCDRFLSL